MIKYYQYKGNIHVHSRYSDGTGDIDDIVRAATGCGLDYIVLTDHRTLAPLREGREGFYGNLAVLAGCELNRQVNHYLALGIEREIPDADQQPQQAIDAVRAQQGVGIIAHPFEKGSPFIDRGRSFPWTDWKIDHFDAIEIWNYCSQWRTHSRSRLKTLAWFFGNRLAPQRGGACPQALRKWDQLNRRRPVAAIGSSDAHAARLRFGPFTATFLPYAYLFRALNTYLLLTEPLSRHFPEAKRQILRALQEGRCFIALDQLRSGSGFRFTAGNGEQQVAMGGGLPFTRRTYLQVESPANRVRSTIIKNGDPVYTTSHSHFSFKVLRPGLYRVEVCLLPRLGSPRPWIYSNAIHIR